MMFDKQYRFRGEHALRLIKLENAFRDTNTGFFSRNVDVYANAPLIGFLYNRKAEVDNTKNPETNDVYNQNVMGDRVIGSQEELLFNFRLIMLLDKEYEPDEEKRIDKAFRNMGKCKEDEDLFDSYVRGGVDVLYEKLIGDSVSEEDFIQNLAEFIRDVDDKFNQRIDRESLMRLCRAK